MRQPAGALGRWIGDAQKFHGRIGNLSFFRRKHPTQPAYCMVEPSVSLLVQGRKQALLGNEAFAYDTRHFLITSHDLPAMMHVIEADPGRPYAASREGLTGSARDARELRSCIHPDPE